MTRTFFKKYSVVIVAGAAVLWGLSPAASLADGPALNTGGIDQAGGTVKGVVKFDGKQVKPKSIRMSADAFCDKAHADKPATEQRYVFGDNNTLQNVFVYISKGLEGKTFPAPTAKATLDQSGCQYSPHVSGVVVGQELDILNSDSTLHNINCQPRNNSSFNEGMPVKGMVITKKFTKPEMKVPVKCDVHPWMNAYIHVMEHPFFAVTQQDGSFTIKGLPAGTYELSVWHEFDKFAPDHQTLQVVVGDGETKEVTVTYSPKKN